MKKSEQLRQEAAREDNDFRAMSLMNQGLREERAENFDESYLGPLESKYDVTLRSNGSYTITTTVYGVIDFFPKANKLLIRKDNKWIKPGLKWIINNLL